MRTVWWKGKNKKFLDEMKKKKKNRKKKGHDLKMKKNKKAVTTKIQPKMITTIKHLREPKT